MTIFNLLDLIAIKKILSDAVTPAKSDKINPRDILQYEKDYVLIKEDKDGNRYAFVITPHNDTANEKAGTSYAAFVYVHKLCENKGDIITSNIYEKYNPETGKTEIVVENIYADTPLTCGGKTWWYSLWVGEGDALELLFTDEEIIAYAYTGIDMKLKPNADGSFTVIRSYHDEIETGDVFVPVDDDKSIWDF